MNTLTENIKNTEKELSLKDIFLSAKNWIIYLLSNWWKIFFIAILGAILFFGYTFIKPTRYTAKTSFVVEEGKAGSGGLASLAGQFGIDIGNSVGATLFSGDNILMFFKSKSLTKETLLTEYDSISKHTLADKYAEVYSLRKDWKENEKIGKDVYFTTKNNAPLTRLQDSLLQVIINKVLKKDLTVERPEKKATFIIVQCVFKDELLSKLFCERIVEKATDWYIDTKTKRQRINVERLEKRADSIENVLNGRTFNTAATQETTLDVNPAATTAAVKLEVNNRNKIMLTQVYAEVIKNLEISKVQLNQETPSIQLVDTPEFPLQKSKRQSILFAIIGMIVFSFLSIFYYSIKYLLKD